MTQEEVAPNSRTLNYRQFLNQFWNDFKEDAVDLFVPELANGRVPDLDGITLSFALSRQSIIDGSGPFFSQAGDEGRRAAIADMRQSGIRPDHLKISLADFEVWVENLLGRLFSDTCSSCPETWPKG